MKKVSKYFAGAAVLSMLFAFVPALSAKADEGDLYTVTYNLTGVTVSPGDTQVTEGEGMDMTFSPQSGYVLPTLEDNPDNISVTMSGVEVSDYMYDDGNLIINDVYGDVVITVNGVSENGDPADTPEPSDDDSEVYSIVYDLYEVKASKQDGNVKAGTKYSVKLKANSGFKLNSSNVSVQVNNEYVYSGYSYNEGVLEIDSVDGDIIIEAIAVPKSSSKKTDDGKTSSNNGSSGKKTSGNQSSKTGGSSKSAQALSRTGASAKDYNTSSYTAPRTGDDGIDIRYFGAFALIFTGAGFAVAGRKLK